MRYRDEKPGDQDRARAAVKAWRAEHPDGTAEQLIVAVGSQFDPEWGIVLRAILVVVDRHMARAVTGITLNWPEPGR